MVYVRLMVSNPPSNSLLVSRPASSSVLEIQKSFGNAQSPHYPGGLVLSRFCYIVRLLFPCVTCGCCVVGRSSRRPSSSPRSLNGPYPFRTRPQRATRKGVLLSDCSLCFRVKMIKLDRPGSNFVVYGPQLTHEVLGSGRANVATPPIAGLTCTPVATSENSVATVWPV